MMLSARPGPVAVARAVPHVVAVDERAVGSRPGQDVVAARGRRRYSGGGAGRDNERYRIGFAPSGATVVVAVLHAVRVGRVVLGGVVDVAGFRRAGQMGPFAALGLSFQLVRSDGSGVPARSRTRRWFRSLPWLSCRSAALVARLLRYELVRSRCRRCAR